MKIVETPAYFSTSHPIVDVEISNDIEKLGWDYRKGEISVAGFFVDDKITQFMLLNESGRPQFQKGINDFLSTLGVKKMHAFNVRMETGCFDRLLGKSLPFAEIMPFRGKGATKEYHFNHLMKKGMIPPGFMVFQDPLNGRSDLCLKCWKDGQFEEVRLHNICCLVKEAKILEHRPYLLKQFGHLVGEDGWLKKDVSLP